MIINSLNNLYTPSFKALHKTTREWDTFAGLLNHTTLFFRYSIYDQTTDEFIMENYLKKAKEPVNIISAGCSYGEEAYSCAMACEQYGVEANIEGIDCSRMAIKGAKDAQYTLDLTELEYLLFKLPDKDSYHEKAQKGFEENFENIEGEDYCFRLKKNHLPNCKFKKGNIVNIEKMYKPNSQDLIFCRYVLYHLSSAAGMNNAIRGLYNVLKPGGLLCLNPDEYKEYEHKLMLAGFCRPHFDYPWLFQKPDVNKSMKKYTYY